MDGDLVDVSKAVVERLGPALPDWEMFWYPVASPPMQSLLVRPDETRFADYQGSLSGYTKWFLRLELWTDATDEESAHTLMGELTSKRGPIITRLRDDELRDTLWDLCGLNIALTDGRRYKLNRRKRLSCDIGLALGAN